MMASKIRWLYEKIPAIRAVLWTRLSMVYVIAKQQFRPQEITSVFRKYLDLHRWIAKPFQPQTMDPVMRAIVKPRQR